MKFTKEKLKLEEGLKREWLITNGIGGFALIGTLFSLFKKCGRIMQKN